MDVGNAIMVPKDLARILLKRQDTRAVDEMK